MAPKAADCKNVHNPNLQCKNDFLPYFDGFFLSLLKVYDHKIIFSWPLCIFGSKITKKNVSLIFYPKIPNPPPLRPLCIVHLHCLGFQPKQNQHHCQRFLGLLQCRKTKRTRLGLGLTVNSYYYKLYKTITFLNT